MGNQINKINIQDDIYITCLDDMEKGKCKSIYQSRECLKCNTKINYNCSEKTLFYNNNCLFCVKVSENQIFNGRNSYLNIKKKKNTIYQDSYGCVSFV